MKAISVLGSTGSIGTQTLEVAREFPEDVRVMALSAGSNASSLIAQAREFRPRAVCIDDPRGYERVEAGLSDLPIDVYSGTNGMTTMIESVPVDTIVAAISGFAGLAPTMTAASTGADLALANKEAIVGGGSLLLDRLRKGGGDLIPVDSEHSALFQCILGETDPLDSLILTASGGPFLGRDPRDLHGVTPGEALAHPRWDMGRKISVDSATMMNKGLEIIEASWIFDVPIANVEVVIHPQSVVHSLVRLRDGSLKAHMGPTDMRYAIMYGLSHPNRWVDPGFADFQLPGLNLSFSEPDGTLFPCLDLARNAGTGGGLLPTVLISADEVAVEAFLGGHIPFTGIAKVVEATLELAATRKMDAIVPEDMDVIFRADSWARDTASSQCADIRSRT